jgi:hypothetical protein
LPVASDPAREEGITVRKPIVGVVAATAVLAMAGVAVAGTMQFRATATGAEEVPVRSTTSEATLTLKIDHNEQQAKYDLKVTSTIDDAFMAHLHRGPVGANGPIAVWLWPHPAPVPPPTPTDPLLPGPFEGRLQKDYIVPSDLCFSMTAPYCLNGVPQWDLFVAEVEAGNVYVNVHTSEFPGGEVRAQVHEHPDH